MGVLVEGKWQDKWYDTKTTGGRFVRPDSRYRNWVTADGSPGPTGEGGFKAEPGRYHLYVSLACPWAHRTLIFRRLKKLAEVISVSVVEPHMLAEGWTFNEENPDHLYGVQRLYDIYLKANGNYSGRVTVPVLWDKQRETIVSNEVGRNNPDAELRVRRVRRQLARFLSGGPAGRDRRTQRDDLRECEQRRLPGRFRHQQEPMRKRSAACSIRWTSWTRALTSSVF
jgi:hypothetical protein